MSRIIFFVLIVAVIYFAWRSMRLKQIQLEKRLDKQEKANLAEHKNDMPGEKMVSCAWEPVGQINVPKKPEIYKDIPDPAGDQVLLSEAEQLERVVRLCLKGPKAH